MNQKIWNLKKISKFLQFYRRNLFGDIPTTIVTIMFPTATVSSQHPWMTLFILSGASVYENCSPVTENITWSQNKVTSTLVVQQWIFKYAKIHLSKGHNHILWNQQKHVDRVGFCDNLDFSRLEKIFSYILQSVPNISYLRNFP